MEIKAQIKAVPRVTAQMGSFSGTKDHRNLVGRDAADQHPMSAITGLGAALGSKATAEDLEETAAEIRSDLDSATTELKEDLIALKEYDKYQDKRTDMLYELMSPFYTDVTDDSVKMVKDIPNGVLERGLLNYIGGRSVVANQYAVNQPFSSRNGITTSTDGIYTVLNGTTTASGNASGWWGLAQVNSDFTAMIGHKVLFVQRIVSGSYTGDVHFGTIAHARPLGESFVLTLSASDIASNGNVSYFSFYSGYVFDNLKLFVAFVDLTTWFGTGNEPSSVTDPKMDEVYRWLAENEGYVAPSIKNAETESVLSRGANLLDIANVHNEQSRFSDGVLSNISTDTRANFQIEVDRNSGSGYVAVFNSNVSTVGHWTRGFEIVEDSHVRIKHNGTSADIRLTDGFFLKKGTYRLSLDVLSFNPTIANGIRLENIMLKDGSAEIPYKPYFSTELKMPLEVFDLPCYGAGVGDAYNKLDLTPRLYRNMKAVKLKDYTWTYNSTSDYMQTVETVDASLTGNVVANNFLCPFLWVNATFNNGRLRIFGTGYTDASTFKQFADAYTVRYEATEGGEDIQRFVYEQKMAEIDLNTLAWGLAETNTNTKRYNASLPYLKINPKLISASFDKVYYQTEGTAPDEVCLISRSVAETLSCRIPADADKNTYFVGKTAYYELATPRIYDITDIIAPILTETEDGKRLYIDVESGGTVTFVNENQLDMPNSISYLKKI